MYPFLAYTEILLRRLHPLCFHRQAYNEQRDKPVESIFLVTYIIVPQDFFKFIDNFVIWREIAKVLFPKRFYPNLIGNGILGEDQIIMDLPSIGLFPGFILG